MRMQATDPRYMARLSKTDRNIVQCGYCGFKMAEVGTIEVEPMRFDEDGEPLGGEHERELQFGPGVLPDAEGIWGLTPHARESVKRGKPPRVRHKNKIPEVQQALTPTPPEYSVPLGWLDPAETTLSERLRLLELRQAPPKLPARARCPSPRCGRVMLLDPIRLRVLAEPHAARVGKESHSSQETPQWGTLDVSSSSSDILFWAPQPDGKVPPWVEKTLARMAAKPAISGVLIDQEPKST